LISLPGYVFAKKWQSKVRGPFYFVGLAMMQTIRPRRA